MKCKIFSRNVADVEKFENLINEFIENKDVKFVKQSESAYSGTHYITISIWYKENSEETKIQNKEVWEGRCNG